MLILKILLVTFTHFILVLSNMCLVYDNTNNSIKCIVDDNDPGIYFDSCYQTKSISSKFLDSVFYEFDGEEMEFYTSGKNISFEPIIDYRWEHFLPARFEDIENTSLSISIKSCTPTECFKNTSWLRCSSDNDLIKEMNTCYNRLVSNRKSNLVIKNETFYYYWTTDVYSNLVGYVYYNHYNCITFQVIMCKECWIESYVLLDEEIYFNETVYLDENQWHTRKICYSQLPTTFTIALLLGYKSTGGNVFWGIDRNFRLSNSNEKRILEMEAPEDLSTVSCQSIDPNVKGISLRVDGPFLKCDENITKYCEHECTACYFKNGETVCCRNFLEINSTTTTTLTRTIELDDSTESETLSSPTLPQTNPRHFEDQAENLSYLYFLFLLIPIIGIGIALYMWFKKRKEQRGNTERKRQYEEKTLASPEWLFKEPEFAGDIENEYTDDDDDDNYNDRYKYRK